MQIVYFNEKNKKRLDEFVARGGESGKNDLGSGASGAIEQTYEWGVFQSKVPGRGKFWALGVENSRCATPDEDGKVADEATEELVNPTRVGLTTDKNDVTKRHQDRGKILTSALIVRHRLPLGLCWLYISRGPIFRAKAAEEGEKVAGGLSAVGGSEKSPENERQEIFQVLFNEIKKIARRERAVFLRIEPGEGERVEDTVPAEGSQMVIKAAALSQAAVSQAKTPAENGQMKDSQATITQTTVSKEHPWAGVTQFKMKFGGEVWRYEPAVEYVFRSGWYKAMLAVKRMKGNLTMSNDQSQRLNQAESSVMLRQAQHDKSFWRRNGFKEAHASYQPEWTLKVDLSASEEQILKQMKPKGRYNIKVAGKKGVEVWRNDPAKRDEGGAPAGRQGTMHKAQLMTNVKGGRAEKEGETENGGSRKKEKTLEWGVGEFYRLLRETTERDQFHGHGEQFYRDMLGVLGNKESGGSLDPRSGSRCATPVGNDKARGNDMLRQAQHDRENPMAKLYLAEYQNEIIAGVIVTFCGDIATYYYGASGNKHRNVMAPYLLQWEAMKEAKKRGCKWYDFLGIAPGGH